MNVTLPSDLVGEIGAMLDNFASGVAPRLQDVADLHARFERAVTASEKDRRICVCAGGAGGRVNLFGCPVHGAK